VSQPMSSVLDKASDASQNAADIEGLARVDLEALRNSASLADDFSAVFLREAGLYPHRASNGRVRLALADPSRRDEIHAILLTLPPPVELCIAKADEIELMLDSLAHPDQEKGERQPSGANDPGYEEDVNSLRDLASGAPVVRFLDELFDRAIVLRATDIHIEPIGHEAQVRIRVDGMLRMLPVPRGGTVPARALISRVKILSGLNIAERRVPQDGRMRIKVRNRDFDLRVATMPTTHGEAAILRLLDRSTKAVDFDQLGFNRRDDALLRRSLILPHGMLIVTGPTGSGKTTTLAAALGSLDHAARKVLTVEDPVEYQIAGVSQTQVRPSIGLTFASALRAFLRQDPDVIMVGEVRDPETAKIAIQAALTGHLVMTTLHTNTAAAAVTRLVDIGVELYLIAATLTAIMGQRLLRVLCPDCKRSYVAGRQELDADPRLIALEVKLGTRLYTATGCDRCGHSGYRGRRAIFEILEVTEAVRRLILSGADDAAIEKQARSEGMTTMVEDGRAKCLAGLTTVDEVFRTAALR
jgi:general secretion pathway protein E